MQLPSFLPEFFQLPNFNHTELIVVKVILSIVAFALPFFVGLFYAKQLGLNDHIKFVGAGLLVITALAAATSFVWPPKPAQVILVYIVPTQENGEPNERDAVAHQLQRQIDATVGTHGEDAVAIMFPFRSEAHLQEIKETISNSKEQESLNISGLINEQILPSSPVTSAYQTGFYGCVFSFAGVFGFAYAYWRARLQFGARRK